MRKDMVRNIVECNADAAPGAGATALDRAFEALATYDWGRDAAAVKPIEDAVAAAHDNPTLRGELETRLTGFVKSAEAPLAGMLLACKHLSRVGGAACVPALAALLVGYGKLAPVARYALERITASEAGNALRAELVHTPETGKIGIINSLGARRETESVPVLSAYLRENAPEIAAAAAAALGDIGGRDAAKALEDAYVKASGAVRLAITDARLACAERLISEGKLADAGAIYDALLSTEQPAHVAEALRRGIARAQGPK